MTSETLQGGLLRRPPDTPRRYDEQMDFLGGRKLRLQRYLPGQSGLRQRRFVTQPDFLGFSWLNGVDGPLLICSHTKEGYQYSAEAQLARLQTARQIIDALIQNMLVSAVFQQGDEG